MEDIRLKLGYKLSLGQYTVRIVHQDESLRNQNVMTNGTVTVVTVLSHGGWMVKSDTFFDISESLKILFLRGWDTSRDHFQAQATPQTLKIVAELVAKVNGRKNVCHLLDDGVLY